MPITINTANAAVVATLAAVVPADPVRNTILATILSDLRRTGRDSWCAQDGAAVAVRTDAEHPVAVSDGWAQFGPLAAALDHLDPLSGLGGPPEAVDRLLALLGRPAVHRHAERLFRCDEVTPPATVPGQARPAGEQDIPVVAAWRRPYLIDVFGRVPAWLEAPGWAADAVRNSRVWLWIDADGRPVSMAAARVPASGVARVGPVYSPPEFRGHGYASAATAAATAETLTAGAVPVLFTDLANPTSNKIYQAIGYRPVADRASVSFG